VLAYLSEADRASFAQTVASLPGHWVSNEGPQVVHVIDPPPAAPPSSSAANGATFLLALDGRPVAWSHGHGRALRWL
jgi:hypothetical protein